MLLTLSVLLVEYSKISEGLYSLFYVQSHFQILITIYNTVGSISLSWSWLLDLYLLSTKYFFLHFQENSNIVRCMTFACDSQPQVHSECKNETSLKKLVQMVPTHLGSLGSRVARVWAKSPARSKTQIEVTIFVNL